METLVHIPQPLLCLLVGYLFGMFLTANALVRARLGKSAFELGTGNPGMANAGKLLGVRGAAVVLAGDILKVVIACVASAALAGEWSGLSCAWTGLGCTLGHNFPAWHRFRGGKGVTTTCSAIVLADPLLGFASMVAGFAVAAVARYLPFGAITITVLFAILVGAVYGPGELLGVAAALLILMALAHGKPAWRALHHEEPQVDIIGRLLKRQ